MFLSLYVIHMYKIYNTYLRNVLKKTYDLKQKKSPQNTNQNISYLRTSTMSEINNR